MADVVKAGVEEDVVEEEEVNSALELHRRTAMRSFAGSRCENETHVEDEVEGAASVVATADEAAASARLHS